ncbi:MAG: threonine--tRNA ligase [Candidatus Pacearchaeota archaeon]|nr:MAG: threonine--tRNA ligase [Candidatus Pacearchaeota archaeon]
MKILTLHCDYIRFKPVKKAISKPEEIKKGAREIKECLVVLSAVEKKDEKYKDAIVKNLITEVRDIAKQVKAKKIVLYPYVHLTSEPSSPSTALYILKQAEKKLSKTKLKVVRAPFGWYKEFEIKCKGHPLSELSREISIEEVAKKEKEEIKGEGKMKELFVILPTGEIKKKKQVSKKEYPEIKIVIKDELGERKKEGKEPPHLRLMRTMEIASHETRVSDAGNLRYLPKGKLIVDLIKDLCREVFVVRLGGMPTKTPCIVSKEDPGAKWMMEQFPERLYKVLPGRAEKRQEFYLRPACDYGTLSILKDASISYKNLPFGLYEFENDSWRYEQRGELLGMYRIRNFMMADLHTMCADINQAFREYEKQIKQFAIQIYYEIGFKPVAVVLNCKEDFFKKYKKQFVEWVKIFKMPIIVKLFSVMKTYKIAWVDVVALDNLKRSMEVTTVQLDTETPKHWDITYTGKDNKKHYPIILHTGIGIDRTIAAILENAASQKNPILPFWLSPTQVRIVPISEKFIEQAQDLAVELNEEEPFVRADIDDRPLHVERRILEAEQEWVPYIVCIGKRELDKQVLSVRTRITGKVKEMKAKEFKKILQEGQGGMPWKPLPLPKLLSKRPKFV